MRRFALALVLGGIGALIVLCLAAGQFIRSTDGVELVVPGATNVQISELGPARLRITYDLPPSKRLQSISQHLTFQGWRRVRLDSFDRSSRAFTRVRLFGLVREIVSINTRPAARQSAELQLTRCVRVRSWVRCL
jgi:hypothetical protein